MVNSQSSVTLFIGNEGHLKEKAIKELGLSVLGEALAKELDYKIFYGGETGTKEILDYVTTFPFSAPRRFVVIKDFEGFSEEDKSRLIEYIKNPSKTACLALDIKNNSILKDHPSIEEFVSIVTCDGLKGVGLSAWIRKNVSSSGKDIEDGAMEILEEMHGGNLASLTQEIDKLVSYVGQRQHIKINDVIDVVDKSIITSTFDLVWAIGQRDMAKSLQLANDLMSAGKKTHEIIGMLSWHFKRLVRARLLQAKGETNYSIVNILGIRKDKTKDFFRQMKSFDIGAVRQKMDLLLEADLDTKRSRLDPALTLEFIIMRLCLN